FSSRGRHTRSKRDWSSDVCSSDLRSKSVCGSRGMSAHLRQLREPQTRALSAPLTSVFLKKADVFRNRSGFGRLTIVRLAAILGRSEERRVGTDGGACGSRDNGEER